MPTTHKQQKIQRAVTVSLREDQEKYFFLWKTQTFCCKDTKWTRLLSANNTSQIRERGSLILKILTRVNVCSVSKCTVEDLRDKMNNIKAALWNNEMESTALMLPWLNAKQ